MKVDFVLSLTWFDPRLDYSNLKSSSSLNTLTLSELRSLWVPEVAFDNTEGNTVSLLDGSAEGHVTLDGSSAYNSVQENRSDASPSTSRASPKARRDF